MIIRSLHNNIRTMRPLFFLNGQKYMLTNAWSPRAVTNPSQMSAFLVEVICHRQHMAYQGGQVVRYRLHDGGWVFLEFFSKKVFGTFWVGHFLKQEVLGNFFSRYNETRIEKTLGNDILKQFYQKMSSMSRQNL